MTSMTRSRVALAAAVAVALAGLLAAVLFAFLGHGSGGGRGLPVPQVQPATESGTVREPPPPPAGAVVLAREAGVYAVALAVAPRELTATVLSPEGGGAGGLDVSFVVRGRHLPATPCGSGCYRAATRAATRVDVRVGRKHALFVVPAAATPAPAFVRRATRAFTDLRSVVYHEHLASGPKLAIDTLWQLEKPDRMTYAIRGGSDAVVIGAERWDRAAGGKWQRSTTTPLQLPAPPWGTRVVDAHILSRDARTVVVSWSNPTVPAWFTGTFDARTALPRTLEMTAAAHFMHHDYLSFNRPLAIRPPTSP
jgi:hypothetical protein